MAHGENIGDATAKEVGSGSAQEFFGGRADHHRAGIASEQQQAVFETGHDGVHVFSQRTEDFMDATKLLTDLRDFFSYLPEFVGAADQLLGSGSGRVVFTGGDAFELGEDVSNRSESRATDHGGNDRGETQSQQSDGAPTAQRGLDILEKEESGNLHAHFAEGRAA